MLNICYVNCCKFERSTSQVTYFFGRCFLLLSQDCEEDLISEDDDTYKRTISSPQRMERPASKCGRYALP